MQKVYTLYKDYLNSRPDSLYLNPHWNVAEAEKYLAKNLQPDNFQLFDGSGYDLNYMQYYKPKVLQIDRVEDGRYRVKTIFMSRCEDEEYKAFSPIAISRHYAVKDAGGNYKLENAIGYDTRNWPVYKYKYITYVVHPYCKFNKNEAQEAIDFCDGIVKQFRLDPPEPITYYITPDSDEMGKILNFDYWLSHSTGRAFPAFRELYTAFGGASYPHEFVHLLFPPSQPGKRAFIINEGLATWLGGPSQNETFEEALLKLSNDLKEKEVTLDDIINNRYRNPFDNNPLYVSGAVICRLVYEKHGADGIHRLLEVPQDPALFKKGLKELFGMEYGEVDKMVILYIKRYSMSMD